jgi:SNF2 family DNA or RNA helicase
LSAITRLQKIANHPVLLTPNKDGKDIEKYERELQFEKFAYGEDFDSIKENISTGNDQLICGKLKVLKSLLGVWKKKGSKVLLFSQSTKNMDILELFLKREKYSFARLDGSIPAANRQKIVDNFNNSPTKFIFLISTKAGGLGLNLGKI